MPSAAIATVTKMMESLPEPLQNQIVKHLWEYIEDLQDELQGKAPFPEMTPELAAEIEMWDRASAEALELVECLAQEDETDAQR